MERFDVPQSPKLRTPKAAKYLNIGKSTLDKLRLTGGGPYYSKLGNKIVVYDPADLEAWVTARRRTSTSDAAMCGPTRDARRAG